MTKEDVIEILERFVLGAKPCSQREIIDACASAYRMLKEQPSLPSDLDETAIPESEMDEWMKYGPLDECDIEVEDVQPISLTEEFMQKNFPTPEEIVWWPLNDGSFRVEMQDDTHLIIGKYNYVHELQHALRLFGKEGEIKL